MEKGDTGAELLSGAPALQGFLHVASQDVRYVL